MSKFKTINDVPFEEHHLTNMGKAFLDVPEMRAMYVQGWQYRTEKVSVICGGYPYEDENEPWKLGSPFYCSPRAALSSPFEYTHYEVLVEGEDDVRTVSQEELLTILNN